MRHILCLCVSILLLTLGTHLAAAEPEKEYSITEFKSAYRAGGTYRIRAYAADIFECPACPPGALCEPCSDSITFSDKSTGRCATDKLCENELAFPVRDANLLAAAKRAGKNPLIIQINMGGPELREMIDTEADASIKRMMQKDPELREKNPIKWLQQNYELQDKAPPKP